MRSGSPSFGTRRARALRPITLGFLFTLAAARVALPATLAGRVLDPDGRAVSDARVVVTSQLGVVAETVTTATGEYEVRQLPDGRYEVRVVVAGFQAEPEAVVLSGSERRDLPVHLRLSAVSESIVVSASQVEAARSALPASVTVITGADLRSRQIETVADALRQVPGLSVARSGGRGALTSIFPRGGASNYTLVLVDGIRTNSFGGAYDFGHLSVANIDRVEVVRGPQSALYGADAIGAVVQVITKRGGAPRAEGVLEAGGQSTGRATFGASGSRGVWSWGLGAERAQSDGYTGTTATGERVGNDDYARTLATGSVSYQRPQGIDATVVGSLGRDERGFPGPWGSDPIGVFPGVDRISRGANDTRRIGARFAHPWSAAVRQRIDASYADLEGNFVSAFGPSSSGTRRFDGRIQEDLAVNGALGASIGMELVRERGHSTYVTGRTGSPIPIDRSVLGLFGEMRYLANDRLNLVGGLRIERMVRDAVEPDPFAFSPRPAFARHSVSSVHPKVAATYLLTRPGASRTMTRLRASAGSGIRPPDVFEIAFTDNPALQPERSRSFEAGVEQQFAGGALVLDAAGFSNRYDDLIVTVGRALGDASRYRTDNISNARARGLELSARARLGRGVDAGGTYTWLSTEILSVDGLGATAPPPFTVGDPLYRRPRHQGSIDVSYTASRLSAFAMLTSRSRILDLEPNYGTFGGLFFTPGYAVLDGGASVALRRGLSLFARVTNATDRAYEETLGYRALGRSGLVGVRIASGR